MAGDRGERQVTPDGERPTLAEQFGRGGVAVGAGGPRGTRRGRAWERSGDGEWERERRPKYRHAGPGRPRRWGWVALPAVIVAVVALVAVLAGSGGPGRPAAGGGHAGGSGSSGSGGGHGTQALDTATAASPHGTPLDPSMFTAGSCLAFSPTRGDRHQTVFIDAGHGGIDPGALGVTESGQAIHEANQTLPVELDAMALLRAQGYRVVVSRTRASTVLRPGPGDVAGTGFTLQGEHDDVASRDVCADMAKATILLGIYFDAGTSPTNAGSITGYDTVRPFAADNQKLANLLQADVLAHLNAHGWDIPNDGVVPDSTLGGPAYTTSAANYDHLLLLGPADPGWFTTPSEMPGALIEPLFITDPFEGSIAASATGREAIAQGMAEAAEQYLRSTPRWTPPSP